MIKFTEHVLENGMRVYLAPMHETQAVTVFFQVNVGSRYETAKQSGLSHFLEHMFFKGTEKRPTTLDISQELDAIGADYNAFTSEETTGYYVSAAAEHFPIAFDVLTDMLYGSTFASEEIEKEKGVIVEEIKMYHDNPMSFLSEVYKDVAFGDTPLGRDIAGKAATVTKFSREDFVSYRDTHYGPENTVLVIAGNPGSHDWLKHISPLLGSLKRGAAATYEEQLPYREGPIVKIGHKHIDQAHMSIINYAMAHNDPQFPVLHVLSNILGGTMSSRLFVEVREKRGLAYYVRSAIDDYHDIGTFDCAAGVDPAKLKDALTVIIEEMERLKSEEVSDVELNRAKQNIKGRLSLRLEDSHSIARYIADDVIEIGKVEQPEDYIEKIEKVSKAAIMEIAQQVLKAEERKLAVVGPLSAELEAELESIIRPKS